jgi:hypothetical protein
VGKVLGSVDTLNIISSFPGKNGAAMMVTDDIEFEYLVPEGKKALVLA